MEAILGSNCLKLPAAAFLALANFFSLSFLLISKNPFFEIKISPLTSTIFGGLLSYNFKGIDFIVFIFFVTFSPICPSPLVDPAVSYTHLTLPTNREV